MRAAPPAILVLSLLAAPLCAQEKKPAPKDAPALELPEAQKVEPGSGYVKIQAKATGPVSYFISGVWDDGTQVVQHDIVGGVLILGIPNKEGLITIVASVNGPAGAPPIQKSVTVTIERKAGAAAKKDAPVSLHATVIGNVDASKLSALADAGVKLWSYALGDPKLAARPDLVERQQKLGGGACIIISDAQGEVVLSQALPATNAEASVLGAVQKALRGKP